MTAQNQYVVEFMRLLEQENRRDALDFILSLLSNEKLTLVEAYEAVIAPSLNTMPSTSDEEMDIWKEHVRTSIIRTIIENCYPFVIKARDQLGPRGTKKAVAVVCPKDEHHEIGARMVTDYFTILGFNAIFVGSNTPKEVFLAGLRAHALDYIALSITNPYHLLSARNAIETIRAVSKETKIIAGGRAISKIGEKRNCLGADYYVTSFAEINSLFGGITT